MDKTDWQTVGLLAIDAASVLGLQRAVRRRAVNDRCPCPYCGSELTDADASRDGEALYCADCGQRVEYFDMLEEAEWRRDKDATDG